MTLALRIILLCVSVFLVYFVLRRIRKAKLQIEYSLFWIGVSVLLLILSVFPQLAYFFAGLCGIKSPVNFIFLFMIFILMVHCFGQTLKMSHLENMIQNLTQEIAVRDNIAKEEKKERKEQESKKSQ